MYKTIPRLVNHNFCENIFDRLSLIFTNGFILTVGVTVLDEEWKLIWNFIFALLCAASKGFMKAFTKAFRCTTKKIKIKVNYYLNTLLWNARGGRVNLSSNPKTPETFQKATKFARKNLSQYSKQNHVNANQLYLCKTFLLWQ